MSFSSNKTRPNNISLDGSQTLSNKTLDSSTIIDSGATITTPSIISPTRLDPKKDTYANLITYAASAQNGELVYATDAKVQYQVKDGGLVEMGSTSSGNINYIANPDFNQDVTGVTGDTNLVVSQETVAPLRGDGSLKIAKEAADASTQSVTIPFTVDTADLAKKLTISFDYDFNDANYADGHAQVRIIQDPAGSSITIRVNGEDIKAGKGKHYAQFQTDATELDYALEIYWVDATSVAVDVYMDNVQVGPREVAKGSIITDWVDFTPNFSGGFSVQPTIDYAKYRRVGDTLEVDVRTTGGTGTAAKAVMDGPPGFIAADNTGRRAGEANTESTDTTYRDLIVIAEIGYVEFRRVSGGLADTSATGLNLSGGSNRFAIRYVVKIQGWSSDAVQSSDLGGREIVARISLGSTQTVSTTAATKVAFDTEDIDTAASLDTVNNRINILESGHYYVSSTINLNDANSTGTDNNNAFIAKNGSFLLGGYTNKPDENRYIIDISGLVYLTKGDYIETYVDSNTDNSYNIAINDTALELFKLASPQTILETETVAARYETSTAQSMDNGANEVVDFTTKVIDTHGSVTTGASWRFTAPVSGLYRASTIVTTVANASGARVLNITKNGSAFSSLETSPSSATATGMSISGIIELDKGDYIDVNLFQNSGAGLVLNGSASYNNICIERIK